MNQLSSTKNSIFLAFFITLFFVINTAISATQPIIGEGRFSSKDGDSIGFVREHLLANAFRDVITKELKKHGFDSQYFWRQFETKFEEHFQPIKEKLQESYETATSKQDRVQYLKELRQKRLNAKNTFINQTGLRQIIQSYSILKRSRSLKLANHRYIKIKAKIDIDSLRMIYNKFTQQGNGKNFRTLYLTTEFELNNISWEEIGVELSSDFTNVVTDHWKKILNRTLADRIDSVVVTTTQEEIDNLQKVLGLPTTIETQAEPSNEPTMSTPTPLAVNNGGGINLLRESVWLKVKINIQGISEDKLLKTRRISFDGDFLLLDLKSHNLIDHLDMNKEKETFSTTDNHKLSSNIASLVYRLPLQRFQSLPQVFSALPQNYNRVTVEVRNVESILDIMSLTEVLSEKGLANRFIPSLESYTGTTGSLSVLFQGSVKEFQRILFGLENRKLNPERTLSFPHKESPYTIHILRQITEEPNATTTL